MSVPDQHLMCHCINVYFTARMDRLLMIKEHKADPCRVQMQTIAAARFFLGSSGCQRNASCCLPLHAANIGSDIGIPQGEPGNSFICRLPSCLLQIFHKEYLPPNDQELQSSTLQNKEDSNMVIGACIMQLMTLNYNPITCYFFLLTYQQ